MAETALITINLRLFAVFRETLGVSTRTLEVPAGTTAGQALAQLIGDYPALAGAEASVSFSVNRAYASADTVLHAGDELAFIPPVSGGGNIPLPEETFALPLPPRRADRGMYTITGFTCHSERSAAE